MRDKDRFLFDMINCALKSATFDYKKAIIELYDLGYRRLEPNEIKILEMLESDTPIDEIEKYRNEEL